ncbi:hypothetical protein LCGC14_0605970 [marine sediment metagenome]|uniref:Uncharacterized protein n=1 Tax=marine sediment metagenome TaxID=412755 RepID=A0A0F9R9A0_9ZZZZ
MLARGAGATTRLVRWWMEDAYLATLRRWHGEMRPKHFRESARSEYHYERRTRAYEKGKRRHVGHTRPLVYSGESERATQRVRYTLTGRSGKLSMDAGNLSFSPKKQKHEKSSSAPKQRRISMRQELTMTTARERTVLGRTFDRVMDIKMRRHDDYLNRTIR